MTNPDDAAYPTATPNFATYGLSKREYFAAMAMQGIVAKDARTALDYATGLGKDARSLLARESVIMADALIAALNKEQ